MLDRREWLQSAAMFTAALVSGSPPAAAADLKTVRVGVGLKSIGPPVINLLIGEVLGYNAEEGLTVKGMALGGNANVQVAVDRGNVEVGVGVPSYALPILARGEWAGAVNFYEYTYPYKWDVVVSPGSNITDYGGLKGKKIGVSDFGGTEYPVTRNVLKSMGIDPDADVKWIAVGAGVAAGVALQRGAIDALAYYDTGFGQIEAAGLQLQFLPRPNGVPMIGGQFLMAPKALLATDRAMLVGLGRSTAKASIFMLANPTAGAQAFLKMFPETAPRGSDAAEAVKSVLGAIARRIKLYDPPYPNARMGSINVDEFKTEAELNGLKVASFDDFYTNDLIEEINRFDADKIRAQAMNYKA
jgi:NitT/TauT family transport system substrate-binding protein